MVWTLGLEFPPPGGPKKRLENKTVIFTCVRPSPLRGVVYRGHYRERVKAHATINYRSLLGIRGPPDESARGLWGGVSYREKI